MKKLNIIFVILLAIFLNSCEDVVNVNLNTEKPRLVIDASINWYKGTTGNEQKVKLTTTTNYFTNVIPTVSGATIYIKNSANTIFNFLEIPNTGEYICNNFVPVINEVYTLTVVSNGQTYTAVETLKSVAVISSIAQNNQGGFTGNDIEIKTLYQDPAIDENYYLYKYKYSNQPKPDYYVDQDEFFQGNLFFSISQNSKLKIGDQIEVTHFGISKQYYNYLSVLLSIAGNSGGGPFQSPPATVKGNIINQTNFDNYSLGYFRLSEADTRSYTIQ